MCKFNFNPRTPVRGATWFLISASYLLRISIHAPLCGVRPQGADSVLGQVEFQSTHPCAGCDAHPGPHVEKNYISIHAPLCGVRRLHACRIGKSFAISIHAPLCGVRQGTESIGRLMERISIHAPLCGVRPKTSRSRATCLR